MRDARRIPPLVGAAVLFMAIPAGAQAAGTAQTAPFTLATSASMVTFSQPVDFSGTVASRPSTPVTLRRSLSPFGRPITTVAQTTTDTSGAYAFRGIRPARTTRYQVQTGTRPFVSSNAVDVAVAISVRLKLSDYHPKRRELVTFIGTAKPAHDGNLVRVQRYVGNAAWKTVKQTALTTDLDGSKYETHVRIRSTGTYRVAVNGDDDHLAGTSRKRTIEVGE
jgi:hypothetical protein